ncbi:MAG: hypothetical protein ACI38B_00920 [Bifidobacterium sp.]|uniref:hypothetical protein n=1 Tax=Bifidobacterium sp. TaxID=41200 RepID=UPI003F04A358
MSRASGVSKEDAGRFRRLVKRFSSDGNGAYALLVLSYWLNGRKAATALAAHIEMFHDTIGPEASWRLISSIDENYPEFARYMSTDIDLREMEALERKAAGMFCDGFLSHPEYPAEEGWLYARMLTRGAYKVGAADRLTTLAQKGKLFTDGFRPIVTMDDMPDYTTVKAWDDEVLERMNAYAVWYTGPSAAQRAYDYERFDKWHPEYERAGVHPDKPVRTADVVQLVLYMAEQGMKDSKRIFRDYLEDTYAGPLEQVRDPRYGELKDKPRPTTETLAFAPGSSWWVIKLALVEAPDYSPYFTPVDGGDPVQAYDDYLKRRQDGQA